MFISRKVKRLQEQLQAVTDENTALHGSNQSLQKQRETLMEENKKLTQQVKDIRTECDATLDAKELERQELCDQLANANEQLEATKKELEQARCTIDKLQAKVARKGCPRDEKGHFIKKDK